MALARIGLGSNLGDSVATIRAALDGLGSLGRVCARSSFYRSAPWGVADQPDFVNAAALLETALTPHSLLDALKKLERRLGRIETFRWGPRTIDLDLLAYADLRVDERELTIPHARLHERAFALVPLAEIDPAFEAALHALPLAERTRVQRIPLAETRREWAVDWDETLERMRVAAEFCATAGLTRFRLEDESLAIEVRRSSAARRSAAPVTQEAQIQNGRSIGASGDVGPPRSVLRAEFVGIVRLSRPAVSPGTLLGADRELAYVEALGIRNPVRSGGSGRVAEVFVNDGEAVDFGQPLFAIET